MKFQRDDKVRLIVDCPQIHLPEPLMPKKGETGRVAKLYRVQDGLEIYEVYLDRPKFAFAAICHTQIEKITPGDGSQEGEDLLGLEEGFQ